MAAEQVIIEFISDTSQLEPGLNRIAGLEKDTVTTFKATNTEINKQTSALKNVAAATAGLDKAGKLTKNNLKELQTAIKGIGSSFEKDFAAGAMEALREAGVSVEQFEVALDGALKTTTKSSQSLKAQLREMTQELARMKVAGEDDSVMYQQLAKQAGALKDAIGDASQEVKNFSSDTSTFDGLISAAQGVAGAFAVVQGAAALFGDESEELQKTLLRVNAAMAILQGLQQVQIVLQKESAAATLVNTIATKAQTIAQTAFNFVVGTSTGLLKAFRIALAATGVGLLVIGLIELVKALDKTDDSLQKANDSIEEQERLLASTNSLIQRRTDLELARLNAANAAESDIIRATGRSLQAQRKALEFANATLAAQRDALDATSEAWFKLNTQIENNNDTIRDIDNQTVIKGIELQGQVAREQEEARKKAIEDEKKRRADAEAKARQLREDGFNDFKAKVELQLLAVEKFTDEDLALRKKLAQATLQIELENEKLTDNQRKLLIQQYFKDRIQLEKDFQKEKTTLALQDILSDVNAELAQLEIAQDRKLELTVTGIRLASEIEIAAAENNAAKIAEITARQNKAIRDAKLASIQEELEYTLALEAAADAQRLRKLQQVANDDARGVAARITAINQLLKVELDGISKRVDALNKERAEGLISERDYNLQYANLQDDQVKAVEDAEKKKTDITERETEKRRNAAIRNVQQAVEIAQIGVDALSSLYNVQSALEDRKIDDQKQKLKDLVEAGAITEKEALARTKKLEAEERRVKNDQARRDKQIAVFNAFLAIPQAYLKGLSQGGLPLAIVYGAFAAVQAGLIAARPLPKFAKGKKNSYQGLGEVGEAGAELVEHSGKMYLADKPTVMYLGARDKVYTAAETRKMLAGAKMSKERGRMVTTTTPSFSFDYEKMGEEVGKHVQTNVYVDGVMESQVRKNQFTNWLNNRRSF